MGLRLSFARALGLSLIATPLWSEANLPDPVDPSLFPQVDIQAAMLGQSLFFDPILSGNQNTACATCHHPTLGTSDGMSLSIGEGAEGLGPHRRPKAGTQIHARIPRNAPALWNKGSHAFPVMFHDGRLALDPEAPNGVRLPQGHVLEAPVMNALAGQALFPITSADEMAGHGRENPIAVKAGPGDLGGEGGAWSLIAAKVEGTPAYREAFDWVIGDRPVHITDIANALSAFMTFEFRSTDSPFDRYLAGETSAMTPLAVEGMQLFYGDAGCSGCHAGVFQTDNDFHAIGMPQIGPGKHHTEPHYADIGLGAVTGDTSDNYRFRTPSLRNVTLTAPYGHAGAYQTLEQVVRHHMDPASALNAYLVETARLHPVDTGYAPDAALNDADEMARITAAIEFDGVALEEGQIPAILAFLQALEDPVALTGRLGVPQRVQSGLPMDVTRPALAEAPPVIQAPRVVRSNVLRVSIERGEVPIPDRGPVRAADITTQELIWVSDQITAQSVQALR